MSQSRNKTITFSIFTLLVLTLIIFISSLSNRSRFFGELNSRDFTYLTGSTIVFTNNWLDNGAFQSRFALYEKPTSIETIGNQSLYISYPPGSIVPIYIICKILNQRATPNIVMGYNLFCQFAISYILSIIVFLKLSHYSLPLVLRLLLSSTAIFFYVFLKPMLFWHQNVFFADQAVLLFFAVAVLLESIADSSRKNNALINVLLAISLFLGLMTDWLFVSFCAMLFLKRIFCNQIKFDSLILFLKSSLIISLPVISFILLFSIQIHSLNGWSLIIDKFLFRTNIDPTIYKSAPRLTATMWLEHLAYVFGHYLLYLLFVLLALFLLILIQRFKNGYSSLSYGRSTLLSLITLTVLPCFLNNFLLGNHSGMHDFSTMKLAIPISLAFALFIPILLLDFQKSTLRNHRFNNIISIFCFCFSLYYIIHYRWSQPMFSENNRSLSLIGKFIQKHSAFSNIIITDTYPVVQNPPQQVALTNKLIYQIDSGTSFKKLILSNKLRSYSFLSFTKLNYSIVQHCDSILLTNLQRNELYKNLETTVDTMYIPLNYYASKLHLIDTGTKWLYLQKILDNKDIKRTIEQMSKVNLNERITKLRR